MDGNSILQQLFSQIDNTQESLLGKRVFVLSYGHSIMVNPLRKSQINLLRPSVLFWLYPGVSQGVITDKTIIVDPNPFHVKILDGRQMGMMRRFIGVYIFLPSKTPMESRVFFIGYAYKVLGVDLSPLGN